MSHYLATVKRPSTGSVMRYAFFSSSQERADEWLLTAFPGWLSLALQLHDDDIDRVKHDIETLNVPIINVDVDDAMADTEWLDELFGFGDDETTEVLDDE